MRFVLIALLAVGLSGAAWAGTSRHAKSDDCEAYVSEADVDAISESVDAALEGAFDALDRDLDQVTLAELDTEFSAIMDELHVELAALDEEFESLNDEREAELEARLEAAFERLDTAFDRDEDRHEPAGPPDAPKRWRPRY